MCKIHLLIILILNSKTNGREPKICLKNAYIFKINEIIIVYIIIISTWSNEKQSLIKLDIY